MNRTDYIAATVTAYALFVLSTVAGNGALVRRMWLDARSRSEQVTRRWRYGGPV